jgi:hypothetical protein
MQGSQDIEALSAGGGFDKQALHTPQDPEKRRKHKVRRIHEKDGAPPCLRFG